MLIYTVLDLPDFSRFSLTCLQNTCYKDLHSTYLSSRSNTGNIPSNYNAIVNILQDKIKGSLSKFSKQIFPNKNHIHVFKTNGNITRSKNKTIVDTLKQKITSINPDSAIIFGINEYLTFTQSTSVVSTNRPIFIFLSPDEFDRFKNDVVDTTLDSLLSYYPDSGNDLINATGNCLQAVSVSQSNWINVLLRPIFRSAQGPKHEYEWLLHCIVPGQRCYDVREIETFFSALNMPVPIKAIQTKFANFIIDVTPSVSPNLHTGNTAAFATNSVTDVVIKGNSSKPFSTTFSIIALSSLPGEGILNEQSSCIFEVRGKREVQLAFSFLFSIASKYVITSSVPVPDFYTNEVQRIINIITPSSFMNRMILIQSDKGTGKSSLSKIITSKGHLVVDSDFYGFVLYKVATGFDVSDPRMSFPTLYTEFANRGTSNIVSYIESLASDFIINYPMCNLQVELIEYCSNYLSNYNKAKIGHITTALKKFLNVYNTNLNNLMDFQTYINFIGTGASQLMTDDSKKLFLFVHNDYETLFSLGINVIYLIPHLNSLISISQRQTTRATPYPTDIFLMMFYKYFGNDIAYTMTPMASFLNAFNSVYN